MAYCQNCGAEMAQSANYCPSCGASASAYEQQTDGGRSDTAKTVLTAAGTVAGMSLLGSALRRRHRRYAMPPHRGMMHGPMRGPMHGPMGGPMGGPGRGGR